MIGDLVILSLYGEEKQDHDDDNSRDVFIEVCRKRMKMMIILEEMLS
jgi:hypothetical protein